MTPEQQPLTKADLTTALDRAIQAMTLNLTDLREEMNRRFESLEQHLQATDRRMDRIANTLANIDQRMAALTRWSDNLDQTNISLHSTQAAQQRAIDQLAARVSRLEQGRQG
jgi:chromosome segregation ATPase